MAENSLMDDDLIPTTDITKVEESDSKVDPDKIKAIASMVDEFNNVVAKNFSVYAQYDDFSFANSRSSE
jgi:hypothetical protein